MNAAPAVPDGRFRAYGHFVIALFFYFMARALARHGAAGLADDQWRQLVEQGMLVFLLLLGYAGLGFTLNRQFNPIAAQGLPGRPGWPLEAAMGMAIGWAAALVCVLAMVLDGGIAVSVSFSASAWGRLAIDLVWFALLCLGEEIAFRGYAFQRFARATGSAGAVFAFALLYAFLQAMIPGSNRASISAAFILAILLSTAYLRTRALWVSWGINFGWKASRALVFGLAISGDNSHSPIVRGDPMGSFWLTGAGFGLEGSWFAVFVLLAMIPVVYRATRDLDFRYNAPHIVPAGIPVDLDAAARRQHEAAMGSAEPAPAPLVQIAPVVAPPAPTAPEQPQPSSGNESL